MDDLVGRALAALGAPSLGSPPDAVERHCWLVFLLLVVVASAVSAALSVAARSAPRARAACIAAAILIVPAFFLAWEALAARSGGAEERTEAFVRSYSMWTLVPGSARTHGRVEVRANSLGLRGGEIPPKKPGETRILCLGDSWTIGQNVEEREAYPRRLEELLAARAARRRIAVVNGGMFGYSVLQGWHLFHALRPRLQPDVVVIGGFNEIANRELGEFEEAIASLRSAGFVSKFLNELLVYRCLRRTISRLTPLGAGKGAVDRGLAAALYRHYSAKLLGECAAFGIGVVVCDHVLQRRLTREEWREACRRRGFPVTALADGGMYCSLPFDPVFFDPREPAAQDGAFSSPGVRYRMLFPSPRSLREGAFSMPDDPGHPSPAGHRVIAAMLAHILVKEGLVP